MSTHYKTYYATNPRDFKSYDTERLREDFLLSPIMEDGKINLNYLHYDRFIAGGAVPVDAPLTLEAIDPLKADYFLERRELGIINIGGTGTVTVDGTDYVLEYKEALYVGRGSKEVVFSSASTDKPAHFYLNSTPAHTTFPTKKITAAEAEIVELGSLETANHRVIRKLIVSSVVDVCQLQMGMTQLESGSVWNTMPAHTHDRRMEVYLYFELPEDQAACHFLGEPSETRHLWLKNEEAAVSPPWSIHSGAGTTNYTFIWGMAGENLDYGDMDKCNITDLK
ncbi:MAG: 5-dehydro-4-deoxy-D-glucuronate isomerase [Mameliella sp.]|nr:5-dehydro-4-deoxy-D-glucuronate isomerase [Phaeodactylibacter sp.]NRA52292.1 5-dehydro-4-deoxy-D-glucuronate isomerase [Phaeodactylibacter sp.]